MSSTHESKFARFTAFWWGLGVLSLFGVITLIAWFFQDEGTASTSLEQVAAIDRYEASTQVEEAQTANLSWSVSEDGSTAQVPPEVVFSMLGKQLLDEEPKPVEDQAQVIPGSQRAMDLQNAPGADFEKVDEMTPEPGTEPDPAILEIGKTQYATCMACHGANGEGGPVGPPLAESNWVNGPVSNLIRIQLRGLEGPITVSGEEYEFPAPMAALDYQTNEQIAAVLTYVRNNFGNSAPPVLPEQVEELRSEVGKGYLTEADLIPTSSED